MTTLLMAAALVGTIALLLSATRTGDQATAGDRSTRGPWGIAEYTPARNRSLNPHERRWQTTLLSGRDNPARWKDLVADIQALEALRGTTPTEPPPASHDSRWIETSIANLERSIDDANRTGDNL